MFTKIDTKSWPRAEIYYYFSQIAPTGYSLTVEIDITNVLKVTKEKGLKFFPAYLWLVTRNLNRQNEFKCAIKDGVLGYFDTLTPMYAAMHNDTKTFSLLWTEYSEKFTDFYNAYIDDCKYADSHKGILGKDSLPPENTYTVSSIPWVEFSHFAVHSYENKPYYFPSIEAGKFQKKVDRIIMPLSITCHHATTDGWHISVFLESLQKDIDSFEKLI